MRELSKGSVNTELERSYFDVYGYTFSISGPAGDALVGAWQDFTYFKTEAADGVHAIEMIDCAPDYDALLVLATTRKLLTLLGVACLQYFGDNAIVLRKTTNEYFQYLFGPWDCPRIKITKHGQIQLQTMYATDPRRRYFTRSFRSTGLSFRLNWPTMASGVGAFRRVLTNIRHKRI